MYLPTTSFVDQGLSTQPSKENGIISLPPFFRWEDSLFDDATLSASSCNSNDIEWSDWLPPSIDNDTILPEPLSLYGEPALPFFTKPFNWDNDVDRVLSQFPKSPSALNSSPDMDTGFGDLASVSGWLDQSAIASEETLTGAPIFQSAPMSPEITNFFPDEDIYSAHCSEERTGKSISPPPLSIGGASPATSESSSSPEPEETHNRRKNKSSKISRPNKKPHDQKKSHNMIEKRYRTNINDKIIALRDTIPHGRIKKTSSGGDMQVKLNKATILSEATNYILYLRKGMEYLNKDNKTLRSRIEAFEILFASQTRLESATP